MWVKVFRDGTVVREDRNKSRTWLKTPLDNIQAVYLINGGEKSVVLSNYLDYWHSRTALAMDNSEALVNIAERIQAKKPDGSWITITWNGSRYINSIESKAIGRPVTK